ncbi:MAG: ABC transporter permease [Candidatus Omnitrophica bacterium]|nr:ABC transporter permease [Candidatus Omnitrophota bacterium]
MEQLKKLQSFAGLILIVIMAILLSPEDRRDGSLIFLSQANITDILRQVSEIGILALAMTFVILTAGIDLCVGSMLALAASTVALFMTDWSQYLPVSSPSLHICVAIVGTVLFCGFWGAVNGFVIAKFRMQPFIVTLAAMIGLRGLARWLTNNRNIDIGFGEDHSAILADFVSQKFIVIGCFVVLAIVFHILLNRTVFGRYACAIGGNEQASRFAGLPIARMQVAVYTLSGLMAGLAGVIHCAQNHQGSPNDGVAYELEAIAAVVIGGTSLMGGKGSIIGTVVGTLIMGVLTNLFRLRGVDTNVEMMAKAVIIIAAVRLQQGRKSL